MFQVKLSRRDAWTRARIRPFLGDAIASAVQMCGFHDLGWGPGEDSFPVQVQVRNLPTHASAGLGSIPEQVELARTSTRALLFGREIQEAVNAANEDVLLGGRAARPLHDEWSDMPGVSPTATAAQAAAREAADEPGDCATLRSRRVTSPKAAAQATPSAACRASALSRSQGTDAGVTEAEGPAGPGSGDSSDASRLSLYPLYGGNQDTGLKSATFTHWTTSSPSSLRLALSRQPWRSCAGCLHKSGAQ